MIDNILSSASELKYMSAIKKEIRNEFTDPDADFVRMLTKRVYDGAVTQKILEQFTALTKRALNSYINDILSERLNIAIQGTGVQMPTPQPQPEVVEPKVETADPVAEKDSKIVTTEEELQAYYIIKSICREVLESTRITYRDSQSYFAIFADDNNRRPISRAYFNSSKKRISVFNENKEETKYDIETLDDIFKYAEELKASAKQYADR